MKLHRLILLTLLFCFIFPLISNADQLEDAKVALQNEDFIKAFEMLQPLAEENNAEAQTLLGALYVNGQGVEMDATKGLSLMMKAAKQGYEPAKIHAFKLNIDLANSGDTAAMYNVGLMCFNGWGGEHDKNVCLEWMETAGKLGHENSLTTLSKIYKEGKFGITPDQEKVTYWNNLHSAFTAGIDGKWEGSVSMGEGAPPMVRTYEFKREGNILTGTTLGFGNKKIPITDGKIEGSNFSFIVKSEMMGMKNTTTYTGIFLGDSLKLNSTTEMTSGTKGFQKGAKSNEDRIMPPVTFIAKRVE